MKYILQLVAGLSVGGMEKVARDIGLYADPSEFHVDYIVFGDNVGEYEASLMIRGCNIFHIDSPAQSYRCYLKSLYRLMITRPYSAVHAHSMFNIGWVMLAARMAKIPIRISHAHSALSDGHYLKKQIYEVGMRFLIRTFATEYVACGQKAGERLYGKRFFKKHGKLIPNGIDIQAFRYVPEKRAEIRSALGLCDCFVIGHTGHLVKVKNQRFLIDLMPEILRRKPNAVLLLLGEGADRTMLEARVEKLHLGGKVLLPGNVPNVSDYLSAMDIFAFPSLYEGTPLSILEVQANGLPCVISDQVPEDVFLTDLLHPHSIRKENAHHWVDTICSLSRNTSEKYAPQLINKGLDSADVLTSFYQLYQPYGGLYD